MKTPRTGPAGETLDTPQHRALGSDSRAAILHLIREADEGLTATDVAEHTRLHYSTVRAHLEQLTEAGLLVKGRASGGQPGRPAWRYRAATLDPAPGPYRSLAAALLDHLATSRGGVRTAVRVGEAWGRQLVAALPSRPESASLPGAQPARSAGPVDSVLAVLEGLGFGPRRQPGPGDDVIEVHLHTCPFLELVGQQPDVMCNLHAGVIRGALRAAGAPRGAAVLEPFAAPTACVARLRLPAP